MASQQALLQVGVLTCCSLALALALALSPTPSLWLYNLPQPSGGVVGGFGGVGAVCAAFSSRGSVIAGLDVQQLLAQSQQQSQRTQVEFKCGKMNKADGATTVTPDLRKGKLTVKADQDQLMHVIWTNREQGACCKCPLTV